MIRIIEDMEIAKQKARECDYAIIYEISRCFISTAEEASKKANWDEVTDAHFFNSEHEIHFYKDEIDLGVRDISDEGEELLSGDDYYEIKPSLLANSGIEGKKLQVRRHIEYDCDGQAYIKSTRLVAIV